MRDGQGSLAGEVSYERRRRGGLIMAHMHPPSFDTGD